jgi:hypothetical protein
MKAAIKQAAKSPKTLKWGVWLNAAAAFIAAVAANWPTLKGTIPLHWWVLGLAVIAFANVIVHNLQQAKP